MVACSTDRQIHPGQFLERPLGLRVTLKSSDDKRIYGFSFPDPVAEADVVEATDTAEDGLRSG